MNAGADVIKLVAVKISKTGKGPRLFDTAGGGGGRKKKIFNIFLYLMVNVIG